MGHRLLEDYDETLWVDNTVALRVAARRPLRRVARRCRCGRTTALLPHVGPRRGRSRARRRARRLPRVYEQLTHYLGRRRRGAAGEPALDGHARPPAYGPAAAAMTAWWEDVLRYSRRDQLSSSRPCAATACGSLAAGRLPHLDVARWPRAEGRDQAGPAPGCGRRCDRRRHASARSSRPSTRRPGRSRSPSTT